MKKEIDTYIIYGIQDIRNDNVIYVGITTDIHRRSNQHFNTKGHSKVGEYIREQGKDNFIIFIIDSLCNTDKQNAYKSEGYYIDLYDTINNGFNKNKSGCKRIKKSDDENYIKPEPRSGYFLSEETKQKLREKWKNRKKTKYLKPDGTVVEMYKSNATQWHPEYIEIKSRRQ